MVSFALHRSFPLALSETSKMEFRFEAFNLFNRSHFGLPGRAIGNVNAGVIRGAAQDNRQLQFGLKPIFSERCAAGCACRTRRRPGAEQGRLPGCGLTTRLPAIDAVPDFFEMEAGSSQPVRKPTGNRFRTVPRSPSSANFSCETPSNSH